jgi:hypothetical protein
VANAIFLSPVTLPLDCTVTKALQGLTILAYGLIENSEIDNPFTNWIKKWFKK